MVTPQLLQLLVEGLGKAERLSCKRLLPGAILISSAGRPTAAPMPTLAVAQPTIAIANFDKQ